MKLLIFSDCEVNLFIIIDLKMIYNMKNTSSFNNNNNHNMTIY